MLHKMPTELWKIIFSGISTFYSIGDMNQLLPIAMTTIADDPDSKKSYNDDDVWTLSLSEFMIPPNEHETVNYSFHITDVVRQKCENFKNILSSMRKRTMLIHQYSYLVSYCLLNIDKQNMIAFDEGIHLVTQ